MLMIVVILLYVRVLVSACNGIGASLTRRFLSFFCRVLECCWYFAYVWARRDFSHARLTLSSSSSVSLSVYLFEDVPMAIA